VNPERDEYLDEDERGRFSPRSVLASGWFRALIVLGALAAVLIVALPYILRWMDGGPAPTRPEIRLPPPPATAPTPAAPSPAPPAPVAKAQPASPRPAAEPRPAPGPSEKARARVEEAPAKAPRPSVPSSQPRSAARGSGSYWIQVGAFQEEQNAQRLASTLKAHRLPVEVATVSRGAQVTSRHEVVVTGASAETVNAALRGGGTAQQSGDVVTVQPTLELREAVALSRRLAGEGLAVRIRRAPGGATVTYHLVRVGGYPSRAAAKAGLKEVEARGLTGFVAQGAAR
jgi:cell division septation protein DedD